MRAPSWFDRAVEIIAAIHLKVPADADLQARKRALNEGRPPFFHTTSWGRKCWERAARQYLDAYRQQPPAGLPLFDAVSPLQRRKAKTLEFEAKLRMSGVPR